MQEVRDLATGMKEAVASLKRISIDARASLDVEIGRAKVNADKVKSLAQGLKEANLEVESFLGESKSNFTPSEGSDTQQQTGLKTDVNGVTLNPEGIK